MATIHTAQIRQLIRAANSKKLGLRDSHLLVPPEGQAKPAHETSVVMLALWKLFDHLLELQCGFERLESSSCSLDAISDLRILRSSHKLLQQCLTYMDSIRGFTEDKLAHFWFPSGILSTLQIEVHQGSSKFDIDVREPWLHVLQNQSIELGVLLCKNNYFPCMSLLSTFFRRSVNGVK